MEETTGSQVVRFGMMTSLIPVTKFDDAYLSSFCKGTWLVLIMCSKFTISTFNH